MQSERAREAAEYRAKGSETARTITATADRDVVVLRGNAQCQADQTRDEGDAERNRIFAEAYGRTRISLPSIARCKPMKVD
jgi:membrane protease subunit HflC